ncbi:hypothetical protein DRF60_06460 [Chryseobacterium elymi]|uniref:Uncharacterized protein n=1 Tax=Chryseobacterium elymi TaxID=395936 RepID=A0A3D9DN89_9FLAO|nr:hypothetical protein DRF60_06460 [Chryseobacterium elymi]
MILTEYRKEILNCSVLIIELPEMINMESFEIDQPEFLLCEKPLKDYDSTGSFLTEDERSFALTVPDERTWVYHLLSESLIEFVLMNNREPYNFINKHKDFMYNEFRYTGVFVKNNCERLEFDENSVLDKAWEYLKSILKWEDEYYNGNEN